MKTVLQQNNANENEKRIKLSVDGMFTKNTSEELSILMSKYIISEREVITAKLIQENLQSLFNFSFFKSGKKDISKYIQVVHKALFSEDDADNKRKNINILLEKIIDQLKITNEIFDVASKEYIDTQYISGADKRERDIRNKIIQLGITKQLDLIFGIEFENAKYRFRKYQIEESKCIVIEESIIKINTLKEKAQVLIKFIADISKQINVSASVIEIKDTDAERKLNELRNKKSKLVHDLNNTIAKLSVTYTSLNSCISLTEEEKQLILEFFNIGTSTTNLSTDLKTLTIIEELSNKIASEPIPNVAPLISKAINKEKAISARNLIIRSTIYSLIKETLELGTGITYTISKNPSKDRALLGIGKSIIYISRVLQISFNHLNENYSLRKSVKDASKTGTERAYQFVTEFASLIDAKERLEKTHTSLKDIIELNAQGVKSDSELSAAKFEMYENILLFIENREKVGLLYLEIAKALKLIDIKGSSYNGKNK